MPIFTFTDRHGLQYTANSTESEIIEKVAESIRSRSFDWLSEIFNIPTEKGSQDIAIMASVGPLNDFHNSFILPYSSNSELLARLEATMGRPFIGYDRMSLIRREVDTPTSQLTSQRRGNLRNNVRLDNNPLLGESPDGIIQQVRGVLESPTHARSIEKILTRDPLSHVRSYQMKGGKTDMSAPLVMYKTLTEIRQYYRVLSCVFFSFELLFARNELFRYIRNAIGASCVDEEIQGTDEDPPRRPISMFLYRAQTKANTISISLAQGVDKMFGGDKLGVNHVVTFEQMLGMCEIADVELVIYNNSRMVSLCKQMTREKYHSICKLGMELSSEDEKFFQRIPSLLHFSNPSKARDRNNVNYRRHPVIFTMSQVHSVVKHIEPVMSHDLSHEVTLVHNGTFKADVKLKYNDCTAVNRESLHDGYISAKDYFNKNFELEIQENVDPYKPVYENFSKGIDVGRMMWAKPRAFALCENWAQYHFWEKEIVRFSMAYQVSIQCIEDAVHERRIEMEREGVPRYKIKRETDKMYTEEAQKLTNQYASTHPFDLQISPTFFSDPQTIEAIRDSEEHTMVDMSHLLGHFLRVSEEKKIARLSTFTPSNSPVSVLRGELYKPRLDDRFSPRPIHSINGLQQYTFVVDVDTNVRESLKKLLEINIYRKFVFHPSIGSILVNQQPYSTEFAAAKADVLEKTKSKIMDQSIPEDEKQRRVQEVEKHINENATKENLAHALDHSNAFVDLLFRSATKKRENAINFVRQSFSSIDDTDLEIAKVYDPVLDETPIPLTKDTHAFSTRPESSTKLIEVDMSKDYLSTAMGSSSLALLPDVYNDTASFVGIQNPRMEKFTVQVPGEEYDPLVEYNDENDYLVHSYIADCGKVLIDIDPVMGKQLAPDIFKPSSPWLLFRGGRRFVWAALVIDLCEDYARKKVADKEIPRWGSIEGLKLHYYRMIQHYVLRIQGGFFDMQMSYRRIVQQSLAKGVKLEDMDIGSEFTSVVERRFVLSRCNYKYEYDGTNLVQARHPVYNSHVPIRSCMAKGVRNTEKMYKAFAESVIKFHKIAGQEIPMPSNYPGTTCGDTIPTGKYINNMFRIFIGGAKYLVPKGAHVRYTNELNHFDTEGCRKRKFKTSDLKDVRRFTRKTQCYVDVVKDLVHARDVMVMPIPTHNGRYLVSSFSATAVISRLGYSAWRDTILALRFAFMSKLSTLFTPYRIKTDSILIEPNQLQKVEVYLSNTLYPKDICEGKPPYMIPTMFPPWKVEEVDLADTENDKTRILNTVMSTPQEPPARTAVGEHSYVRKLLDKMGTRVTEERDSDLFYKFVQENAPQYIQDKADGQQLHRSLWAKSKEDPSLSDLYVQYTDFRSTYLLDTKGAILVGEPGAGKSTTIKSMISKTSHAAVVAPMHSILRGYHGCNAMVSTMHSFFGVSLDLATASKRPRHHLELFWGSRGYDQKKIKTLFIDEAEMASKSFEELIRIQHDENYTKIFITGDPNQSAPMFGRGFDMFGNVARAVSYDRVFRFDMQFRNYDFEYMDKVHDCISKGTVAKLLSIPEGTYYPTHEWCDDANRDMPSGKPLDVVHETIEKIVDRLVTQQELEWTISVQNYKVMGMIWLEVYRRWSRQVNPNEYMILTRSGSTETKGKDVSDVVVAYEETNERGWKGKQSKSRVDQFRELTSKSPSLAVTCWDKRTRSYTAQEKSFIYKNGPSGRLFLVGLPLVFYPGATFVSSNRFQSAHQHKALDGERLESDIMVQLSTYKYMGSFEDQGVIRDPLDQNKKCVIKYRVLRFTCEWSDEETHITEMEASMFLMPSFLVLHSFCIGATLDKFLVLRISQEEGSVKSYESLHRVLSSASERYGKHASCTETARAMCVARTRVRTPEDCIVADMTVESYKFWMEYWRSGNNFVVFDAVESDQNYSHFERMRMNILLGKSSGMIRGENGKAKKGLSYPKDSVTRSLPFIHAKEYSSMPRSAWTGHEKAKSFPWGGSFI